MNGASQLLGTPFPAFPDPFYCDYRGRGLRLRTQCPGIRRARFSCVGAAQAWFQGMNSQFDDVSAARLVLTSARAFTAEG